MALTIDLTPDGSFSLKDESGHVITVPSSLSGLIFLKHLLSSRRACTTVPAFASPARPTQAMVNAYLSTHKVEKAPMSKPRPPLFPDLDLELDL